MARSKLFAALAPATVSGARRSSRSSRSKSRKSKSRSRSN